MGSPVVFNHIPKTAGTALTRALADAVAAERLCTGIDLSVFGAHTNLASLALSARRQVIASPDELPGDADFVAGHLAPSTTRARYPEARTVTVLREPRSRLLSQWLFFRAHSDRQLRGWGGYGDLIRSARLPLADYLSEPRAAAHSDNLITRFLVWPHPAVAAEAFIDPAQDAGVVGSALATLRGFGHVCTTEQPEFVNGISDWLGRDLQVQSSNEMRPIPSRRRPDLDRELDGPTRELLEARTRLDRILWSEVLAAAAPELDPARIAERTFADAVDRYVARLANEGGRRPLPRRLRDKVRRRRQHRMTHL